WMTVAEVVPVTGAIVLLGLAGAVEPLPALLAAALVGAMIGFAPFNRPVARVFLGDVGSLPIGLLLGWLLMELAAMGHVAAALLLPLYYLADATIPLAGRVVRGEPFWQAHRTHFYQRATDCGLTVREIVTRVFVVNLALAALALITVAAHSFVVSLAMLSVGALIILWLLATFAGVIKRRQQGFRPRGPPQHGLAGAHTPRRCRATRTATIYGIQAAPPPKSGTASCNTPKMTDRSSRARPCSSAASQPRIASSDGLTGLAATMPSMPIGAVGPSRAHRISCQRSPGLLPEEVTSISRPCSRPA